MTTTIQYQNHTQSLVSYHKNGRLFQSVSYNIKNYVAQVLNIQYYMGV